MSEEIEVLKIVTGRLERAGIGYMSPGPWPSTTARRGRSRPHPPLTEADAVSYLAMPIFLIRHGETAGNAARILQRSLEQRCRYLLRAAVAQARLRLIGGDRILLTLETAWADGTRHLIFEPMELLEKLAALTPRPRVNLVPYHGVLAPHAGWRVRVVA